MTFCVPHWSHAGYHRLARSDLLSLATSGAAPPLRSPEGSCSTRRMVQPASLRRLGIRKQGGQVVQPHGAPGSWHRERVGTVFSHRGVRVATLVAALLMSGGCSWEVRRTGSPPSAPTTEPSAPFGVIEDPACARGIVGQACNDIHTTAIDLIEFPGMTERLQPSRIVVTPDHRVRYEAKLRRKGDGVGGAARDYDRTFARHGWTLLPDSALSVAGAFRHYRLADGPNKRGFEATFHLREERTVGAPPDAIVEAVMHTTEPVLEPRGAK